MAQAPRNPSIQAVLVDFGGVVYHTPRPGWLPFLLRLMRLARHGKVPENGIILMMHVSVLESQVVMDLMTGKTPEQKLWEDLRRSVRIPTAWFERIRRGAFAPKRLNKQFLEYISSLRPKIKTALLTNAGSDFRATFVKEYQLEQYFDQVIISAEEELAKPDPKLYQKAVDRLGVAPQQAIFFDDLKENVSGAREKGILAYQYQSNEQAIRLLEQFL
jgi:epoxide hydrolase-like predicted phosphatase